LSPHIRRADLCHPERGPCPTHTFENFQTYTGRAVLNENSHNFLAFAPQQDAVMFADKAQG
jgi:hypothetical protein